MKSLFKILKIFKIYILGNKNSLIAKKVLKESRKFSNNGNYNKARNILVRGLKNNKFILRDLWIELVALMETNSDFELIRNLWIEAPNSISKDIVICNAFARAAAITENKNESRALLRHLLVLVNEKYIFSSKFIPNIKVQKFINFPINRDFSAKASIALNDLYKVSLNMPKPFLISGTLLGLVREGKFIGWDKDIDVGIFCTKEKAFEIEKEFRKSKYFEVRKLDLTTDRIRIKHLCGASIDIFPHYLDKNNAKVWHDGAATRWWNSPFTIKETKFLGKKVWIPSNPELYLDENYGNWRIPVKNFDARLDAPNAEVTNKEYLTTLNYFALLSALKKSQIEKINRYSKLLAKIEKDEWFLQFQR